jgi:hypothetical protein
MSHHEHSKNGTFLERKALILLSSCPDETGVVGYVIYQCQAVKSLGRNQSSGSYVEHSPFSVLSHQCASGEIKTWNGSSIASVFLASASFQFDLRQRHSRVSSHTRAQDIQLEKAICTLGVIRTPGCGLEALVISSMGVYSGVVLQAGEKGNLMSFEIASYYLSDIISGGDAALMGFYTWTLLLASGRMICWIVPSMSHHHSPTKVKATPIYVRLLACSISPSHSFSAPRPEKKTSPRMPCVGSCVPWAQQQRGCTGRQQRQE